MQEGLLVEYTQNQTVTNTIYTGRSRAINVSRSKVTASLNGAGWTACGINTGENTPNKITHSVDVSAIEQTGHSWFKMTQGGMHVEYTQK